MLLCWSCPLHVNRGAPFFHCQEDPVHEIRIAAGIPCSAATQTSLASSSLRLGMATRCAVDNRSARSNSSGLSNTEPGSSPEQPITGSLHPDDHQQPEHIVSESSRSPTRGLLWPHPILRAMPNRRAQPHRDVVRCGCDNTGVDAV